MSYGSVVVVALALFCGQRGAMFVVGLDRRFLNNTLDQMQTKRKHLSVSGVIDATLPLF
jgi:hypothetical protein